jgi:ABC-type sugar transport system permease subunit
MKLLRQKRQVHKAHSSARQHRHKFTPYVFISPFYILFGFFFLGPTIFAFVLSLYNWTAITEPRYLGLQNYDRLLTDPLFWQAVQNTLIYAGASIFIVCPLALFIAMALNSQLLWFKPFWRAVYFAPIVTSSVAITLTFLTLYNRDFGLINALLIQMGLDPVNWLGDRTTVKLAVIGVIIWRWTGLTSIYFLAGLQSISKELYEAAQLDGADSLRQFWYITLPQLRPVMLFVGIIVTIGAMQIFDEPQILTGGGPANASLSVVQYLFTRGIGQVRFGYASAIGVILFAAIFVLSLLQLRAGRGFRSD